MTEAYEIDIYKTTTGKEPYTEWEKGLDKTVLARKMLGLLGLEKPVI